METQELFRALWIFECGLNPFFVLKDSLGAGLVDHMSKDELRALPNSSQEEELELEKVETNN